MAYATTNEIFTAIKPLLSPRADEFVINETLHMMATSDVNNELVKNGIDIPATDMGNYLKLAEILYYMDLAKEVRQIELVGGRIRKERWGSYQKEYANSMPMFFFASGGAEPFYALLATETVRMRGYKYCKDYIHMYFKQRTNNRFPKPTITRDITTRGYGWETESQDLTNWKG